MVYLCLGDVLVSVSLPEFAQLRSQSSTAFFLLSENCGMWSNISFSMSAVSQVQVFYSLISSLKTYHLTLYFTPWSLDLFIHVPGQLPGEHTVLQPFRRIELIVHIAISVLPGTNFHLSQVKHLRVKCLAQGHTILTMSKD